MKRYFLLCVIAVMTFFTNDLFAQDASWFSEINVVPEKIYAGTSTVVKVTLKVGPTRVKKLYITGGIDGAQLVSKTIDIQPKMRHQVIQFNWKAEGLGEHTAYFELKTESKGFKPAKVTRKINVEQMIVANISQPVVTITHVQPQCEGNPLPDISVDPIDGGKIGYNAPGSVLTVSLGIKNTGQCETGVFKVRVKVRTHYQGTTESEWKYYTIQSIPPERGNGEGGYTINHQFQTINADNVEYDFIVEADYDEQINEFREDNNKRYAEGRFRLEAP